MRIPLYKQSRGNRAPALNPSHLALKFVYVFKVTKVRGNLEASTIMVSPSSRINLLAPSRPTQAGFLLSFTFSSFKTAVSGTTRGLKDKLCGANGVSNMHCVVVSTILPPAERL